MLDNFELSDTKQVRKTLLIASFTCICFKALIKHSTENIEFLGFKIPVEDASVIPKLIGYLITYMVITLIIRYNDEDLRKKYKSYVDFYETNSRKESHREATAQVYTGNRIKRVKTKTVRFGIVFVDIIFPLVFAFYTLFQVFIKK